MNFTIFTKLLRLAVRNLFRNKRRTLITLLLVVVGFVAMGTARGYFVQTLDGLQQVAIRSGFAGSLGSGDIVLRDKRYATDEEDRFMDFAITDPQAIIDAFMSIDGADYALPRTQMTGLASNGEKSLAFRGYAIDPNAEARLREGLRDIAERTEGFSLTREFLALGDQPFRASIGVGLARALKVGVGDSILLLGTTVDGAVNAIDVEIAATIATGSNEVDRFFLVVSSETMTSLTNAEGQGEISFMLKDRSDLDSFLTAFMAKVKEVAPDRDFEIVGWEDAGVYYPAVRDLFTFMFGFLEWIIIIIVLISSWNVVNMTVMERVSEIGTMRSLGLTQRTIGAVFLMEGLIAGIIAVILGFALQLLLVLAINNAGIVMPPPPGGNQSFILQVRFVTQYHWFITLAVIGAMTAANISALLSIRRLSITDALAHV